MNSVQLPAGTLLRWQTGPKTGLLAVVEGRHLLTEDGSTTNLAEVAIGLNVASVQPLRERLWCESADDLGTLCSNPASADVHGKPMCPAHLELFIRESAEAFA